MKETRHSSENTTSQVKTESAVTFLVHNGKVTRLGSNSLPKNFYLGTFEVFDPPIPLKKAKRTKRKKQGR